VQHYRQAVELNIESNGNIKCGVFTQRLYLHRPISNAECMYLHVSRYVVYISDLHV